MGLELLQQILDAPDLKTGAYPMGLPLQRRHYASWSGSFNAKMSTRSDAFGHPANRRAKAPDLFAELGTFSILRRRPFLHVAAYSMIARDPGSTAARIGDGIAN
jgi:hypothetical protein